MENVRKGPAVPGWLAAGIIGIALGVSGGYYGAHWNDRPNTGGSGAAMAAGGMGGMGGGRMGGGGMGGAQQHPQAMALVRSIGAVATLEQARGKELSSDQREKLTKLASGLDSDKALTESDCEARLKELNGILNPAQQELITDMTARPGGGRGGPGGPGGAGGPGGGNGPGARSGGGPGGGGPGGGAGADMDHPFKEGRGHDRLQLLVQLLKK